MRDMLSGIFVVAMHNCASKLQYNSAVHDGDFICLKKYRRIYYRKYESV